MSFNPLEHKGVPVDEQVRSWRELNVDPALRPSTLTTRC